MSAEPNSSRSGPPPSSPARSLFGLVGFAGGAYLLVLSLQTGGGFANVGLALIAIGLLAIGLIASFRATRCRACRARMWVSSHRVMNCPKCGAALWS